MLGARDGKEIGGFIGLEIPDLGNPFHRGTTALSSGRECLAMVLGRLGRPAEARLPPLGFAVHVRATLQQRGHERQVAAAHGEVKQREHAMHHANNLRRRAG